MAESDIDREIFSTVIGLGSVTKQSLVELMTATQKRETRKIEVRFDSLVHHGFLKRALYDYDTNQAEVQKKATKEKKRTKKESAKKKKEVKKELDKGMLALIGEADQPEPKNHEINAEESKVMVEELLVRPVSNSEYFTINDDRFLYEIIAGEVVKMAETKIDLIAG